jgi:uncharacterized protein (DUF2249 family)
MLVHANQPPPRAPRTAELKLCDFPRSHHTSVVFERLDDLGPEGHLLIACDYEPKTVRRQIETWCPDEYRWTWLARGPAVWRADITRLR